MTDPKKLVPSCTCPPPADSVEAPSSPFGRVVQPDENAPIGEPVVVVNNAWSPPAVDFAQAPPSAEEATQALSKAAGDSQSPDAAAAFVEASVAVDRRAFTSTAELMAAARVWCAENEVPVFHPRALAGQLKRRRGVQAHSNGQRRGWRGVKLR